MVAMVVTMVTVSLHRGGSFRPFLVSHAIDFPVDRVRIGSGLIGGRLSL